MQNNNISISFGLVLVMSLGVGLYLNRPLGDEMVHENSRQAIAGVNFANNPSATTKNNLGTPIPVLWEALDKAPRMKNIIASDYPDSLFQNAQDAEVRVQLVVGVDGRVSTVNILESPDPAFVEPALDSARQVVLEPATKNGIPVAFAVETIVQFYPDR